LLEVEANKVNLLLLFYYFYFISKSKDFTLEKSLQKCQINKKKEKAPILYSNRGFL